MNDGMSKILDMSYLGEDYELLYRPPTPKEIAAFRATRFKRKGRGKKQRIEDNSFDACVKGGWQIVTGMGNGPWVAENGKPFTSDPEHKDYNQRWKAILLSRYLMHLEAVGLAAYNVSTGDDIEISTGPTLDDLMDPGESQGKEPEDDKEAEAEEEREPDPLPPEK